MTPITVSVPISVMVSSKRRFSLNLNQYRNADFHTLNKAKTTFTKEVLDLLSNLPRMLKLSLTYELFFGTKQRVDTANVCSVVDKFFSDALKEAGVIEDDHSGVISDIRYRFGGVDQKNPRMDVTIHDYETLKEKDPMKIIIVQAEIEEAIRDYVLKQIAVKEGQSVHIDFRNTRGEDGATAEIIVSSAPVKDVLKDSLKTEAPKQGNDALKPKEAVKEAPVVGGQTGTKEPAPVNQAPVSEVNEKAPDNTAALEAKAEPEAEAPLTETQQVVAEANKPVEKSAEEKADEPAVGGGSKSLFGHLLKPQNS